jgi:hypothetical protein
VGEAVGVDSDALQVGYVLLAQRALDRGTRLAPVENNRLVVEDSPLVEHVRVGADRAGAAAWVEASGPEITGRLQAHHVGRGIQAAAPEPGDRMAAQEKARTASLAARSRVSA